MLSAIFPFLRGSRRQVEKLLGGDNWVFCSELVFKLYSALGMFDDCIDVSSKDVVPMDLLGYDEDGLPLRLERPPTYVLGKKWAKRAAVVI